MIKRIHIITAAFKTGACLRACMLLLVLCCWHPAAKAQYFDLQDHKKHVTVPFKMIRDMIVIRLKINNKGPFNFILDTGVGLMVITDPKLVDSIDIPNKRTLRIKGIGDGDAFEAYVTSALNIQIPGLKSYDVAAAILKTDHFGLSNYAGLPIHGLLGYEFFNNLAVKINFSDSTLSVSRPIDAKLFRKGTKLHMSVEERKPYIRAKITFPDGRKVDDKLVLDLGAGHALSLENIIAKSGLPSKFIQANLGVGLTGPVNGFLSRVKELDLARFKIKDVITSFPQGDQFKRLSVKRDGNLGIGILKRFEIVIDYPDSAIYLKPGPNFSRPFEHDMSGMEYYTAGDDLNRIVISRVEPGSPADEIGLEKDDEILAINLKPVNTMSIEQIDAIFKSQNDRSLLLEVYHDGKKDEVVLTLKRRI
ncbi:MAG TPA: aspartyl protease family protein [Mucilaginibacter sp.]|nr:aspartyl protease family protein [Mucilaginibacter sp.]